MKKSLTLLVFLSLNALAQTETALVKQLENLPNVKPEVKCEACQGNFVLTPEKAIEAMNAGKLVFLGRDLFPGSDQNKTCVFKSDAAYILYNNCMANKKEASATDITVVSFQGGTTRFYIENKTAGAISEMTRPQYDSSWTIDFVPSEVPGDLSVQGLKKYIDAQSMINNKKGACFIGGSFKAQDMSVSSQCFGPVKGSEIADKWSKNADVFWKAPVDGWYQAQKSLRKLIISTKF